jgi:PBP1b-binding outer membrane lipoprotein LpoB
MNARLATALAATLALAACVAEEPPLSPNPDCGAAGLQDLIGQPASMLETMKFSQPVRVIRPGMAVTMDYFAGRLNIETDAADRITRVTCG